MDSILRDIDREHGKMLSDITKLNQHYDNLQDFTYQYIKQTTIEWAKLILDHPKALLLIIESTRIVDQNGYAIYGGYGEDSEPIRFTTLSLTSGQIWDQFIYPSQSQCVQGTEYHGLTLADLEGMPTISEAWLKIVDVLADRHIIIFGADYARQVIRSVYPAHILNDATCLHNRCKEYYREFYELSLEKVLAYQGINKKRSQLTDSRERILMQAQVIRNLAAGMEKQVQEPETSDDDTLDDHPF